MFVFVRAVNSVKARQVHRYTTSYLVYNRLPPGWRNKNRFPVKYVLPRTDTLLREPIRFLENQYPPRKILLVLQTSVYGDQLLRKIKSRTRVRERCVEVIRYIRIIREDFFLASCRSRRKKQDPVCPNSRKEHSYYLMADIYVCLDEIIATRQESASLALYFPP